MDRGAWWLYSPRGHKGSDMNKATERAHTHTHTQSVTSNAQTQSLNTVYKEVDNTLAPCENVFIP